MKIGDTTYTFAPGEIAVIFPNIPHDYHTLSKEGETQLNIYNGYPDLLPTLKSQLLTKRPACPRIPADRIHEDVIYAENRLLELYPSDSNKALIGALLSLILCRLFPELELIDYQQQPPRDITSNVIAYIAEHYREDISLTSVSNHFGIGKYYLSRLFSNVLGCNFLSYVNSLRIEYANLLLVNTDMSVIRVAIESGFHNQQTFNRVFRQYNNCTPKEYQQAYANSMGRGADNPAQFYVDTQA
jgi:AraC-like DNA-binding protein